MSTETRDTIQRKFFEHGPCDYASPRTADLSLIEKRLDAARLLTPRP